MQSLCYISETQPKILGNWTNDGVCEPINSSSKCGEEDQGNQMQKRDCEPGDIDICNNDTDIHRSIPCMFPCPTEGKNFIQIKLIRSYLFNLRNYDYVKMSC